MQLSTIGAGHSGPLGHAIVAGCASARVVMPAAKMAIAKNCRTVNLSARLFPQFTALSPITPIPPA